MAETEAVVVESAATPEQQAAAEKLGWIPPARFKGDPARFVDAAEYIERGETVLPIVKEQNKRLHTEIEAQRTKTVELEAALAKATKAIEEIEERNTVATQKAVEAAKREVKSQLMQASEAGDHAAVAELTERMVDLSAAAEVKPPAAEKKPEPPKFTPDPELAEWNKENPWFGANKRKTALAIGIAQELRDAGESSTGRVFYNKVLAEVNKELGVAEPRGDKVEGGRNGSGDDTRTGSRGGKSYANLPAEAKAACDVDAKAFVGPTKKYKDLAAWRGRYAELYFQE